jgi:hypothetical protein
MTLVLIVQGLHKEAICHSVSPGDFEIFSLVFKGDKLANKSLTGFLSRNK